MEAVRSDRLRAPCINLRPLLFLSLERRLFYLPSSEGELRKVRTISAGRASMWFSIQTSDNETATCPFMLTRKELRPRYARTSTGSVYRRADPSSVVVARDSRNMRYCFNWMADTLRKIASSKGSIARPRLQSTTARFFLLHRLGLVRRVGSYRTSTDASRAGEVIELFREICSKGAKNRNKRTPSAEAVQPTL